MEVLLEEWSNEKRRRRNLPDLSAPLPRFTSEPRDADDGVERYEVVVVGAGPSGLLMTLLLLRYGLSDSSLLCIEACSSAGKAGHADGLNPPLLDLLSSLGLIGEVERDGVVMYESTTWAASTSILGQLERTRRNNTPHGHPSARFKHFSILSQGRIERILLDDMKSYSQKGVQCTSKLVDVSVEEIIENDFPVVATIDHKGQKRTVRCKYLIGADGAHSAVRRLIGSSMEGSTSDDIWGVIDGIFTTNFPDLRMQTTISSAKGMGMVIPREKVHGQYMTRIYVSMTGEKRENISAEHILAKAKEIFEPFTFRLKEGKGLDWWAAYQVGQRVADHFIKRDSNGDARIFLIGDACHTHSPKLGQGMNVSMLDAYDLSWKLFYALHGLTSSTQKLLSTYEIERRDNALNLISLDKRWYTAKFAQLIDGQKSKPAEEVQAAMKLEVMNFVAGVSIQYPPGLLTVDDKENKGFQVGVWMAGRALSNVKVTRYADGKPMDLLDDFESTGMFRILVLTGKDLISSQQGGNQEGISMSSLRKLSNDIIPLFPAGVVEIMIVHPVDRLSFEWGDIPEFIKKDAEMHFYCADESVYATYGVSENVGGITITRPDGYLGVVAGLDETGKIEHYLRSVLKTTSEVN